MEGYFFWWYWCVNLGGGLVFFCCVIIVMSLCWRSGRCCGCRSERSILRFSRKGFLWFLRSIECFGVMCSLLWIKMWFGLIGIISFFGGKIILMWRVWGEFYWIMLCIILLLVIFRGCWIWWYLFWLRFGWIRYFLVFCGFDVEYNFC